MSFLEVRDLTTEPPHFSLRNKYLCRVSTAVSYSIDFGVLRYQDCRSRQSLNQRVDPEGHFPLYTDQSFFFFFFQLNFERLQTVSDFPESFLFLL